MQLVHVPNQKVFVTIENIIISEAELNDFFLTLCILECVCSPDEQRAVESGAVPVSKPEEKEWGQKVGYVRDLDGIVIRMGSYVQAPKQD